MLRHMVHVGMFFGAMMTSFVLAESPEPPAQFVALTFNIRYDNAGDGLDGWSHRRAAVAKFLGESKADVIALQEVLIHQLEYLQQELPDYQSLGVGRDDGRRKGEFTPLLIRKESFEVGESGTFWLSESPEKPGSKSWDSSLPRICTWAKLKGKNDRRDLLVAGTHFDHRGTQARARSAELLRRKLPELAGAKDSGEMGLPILLMGDFNSRSSDEPFKLLVDTLEKEPAPFADTRSLTPEDQRRGPDSTWNGFKKIEPGQRIDFIFSRGLEVLQHETVEAHIGERFLSDHLPVVVTVR